MSDLSQELRNMSCAEEKIGGNKHKADRLLSAANEIDRLEFEYERADQSAKRLGAKWKEATAELAAARNQLVQAKALLREFLPAAIAADLKTRAARFLTDEKRQ